MWIIPSQLSKCAPDMVALDLASKTSLASDCEPSHIVSLRGSLKPISSVKWKRDSWMQHLYGAILKPSHTDRFTDWWTSSLQDTLVSRSLPQASEPVKTTQDTFGLGLQTEFDFFNQDSACLKMSKDTLAWDCAKSSETWEQQVTRRRGEYSARVKSARLTSASAPSSWPTIRASEYKDVGPIGSKSHDHMLGKGYLCAVVTQEECGLPAPANHSTLGSRQGSSEQWRTPCERDHHPHGLNRTRNVPQILLSHQVEQKQWATPRSGKTTDENPETWAKRQEKGDVATMPLTAQVKCWGTPTARDHKSGRGNEEREYKELTPMVERTQAGKLNPQWVTQLMGLNLGWVSPSCPASVIRNWPKFVSGWSKLTIARTSFAYSETESCLPPQSELFECFGRNSTND